MRYQLWRRAGYILSFLMVAGVAARVSYSHIRDVAVLAHQAKDAATLLPLSVDGMMLIATLAMAEDKAANRKPRTWARVGFWFGAVISVTSNITDSVAQHGWNPIGIGVASLAPALLLLAIEVVATPGKPKIAQAISDVTESAPVISVAELESPKLPAAPVSPAVVTEQDAERGPYGPRDGVAYSERHVRRLRNGR